MRVARTEAQIIETASGLFLEKGYVATTLAEVAERAGVGARTVYVRFGTKAALFSRVVDQALVGDAQPVDVAHRPRALEAMTAATLTERIEAFVDVSIGIAERAGGLFEVAAQAEVIEPELASTAMAGRRATAGFCRSFWDKTLADKLLAKNTDLERLVVLTDILLCADTTVHLRRVHDWSSSAHRSLIIDTLTNLTNPSG